MTKRFGDGRDWFFEKRFGMFVHWGIYSVPAWHEQIQWRRNMPRGEYARLAEKFNPKKYDPEEWLDLAEEAGMEYLCFTTKHHDGFCMWDTKETSFNIMNTPYKKDILDMLAKACHKRKFPLCLYYSVADWKHPNYPNQGRHHEPDPQRGDSPHMEKYVEYVKSQIRELCSNYGEIHGIWWDMNVSGHRDPSVARLIRRLQPKAVMNDRGFGSCPLRDAKDRDFSTPERHLPEGREFSSPVEACQSLGVMSWGHKTDEDFFSRKYLTDSVDRVLAMGGNYLLNVGPKADGTIQKEFQDTLRATGRWHRKTAAALRAEPASSAVENNEVLLTRSGDDLYVHFNPSPAATAVRLPPLEALPEKAVLLNDGRRLECVSDSGVGVWYAQKKTLRIRGIPVDEFAGETMIAKLSFKKGTLSKILGGRGKSRPTLQGAAAM